MTHMELEEYRAYYRSLSLTAVPPQWLLDELNRRLGEDKEVFNEIPLDTLIANHQYKLEQKATKHRRR